MLRGGQGNPVVARRVLLSDMEQGDRHYEETPVRLCHQVRKVLKTYTRTRVCVCLRVLVWGGPVGELSP